MSCQVRLRTAERPARLRTAEPPTPVRTAERPARIETCVPYAPFKFIVINGRPLQINGGNIYIPGP